MNSKAAQLRENGTEIVRLFARFALGASFLSAVADRFGLWGPYGAKNVSWGDFAHFVEYTGAVTAVFHSSLTLSFAWAATVAETLFGILLITGFKIRITSVLSGLLLLSFAMGMATSLGIKTPFDYSVFSAAAAAFLLAFWGPDRFALDKLLNRLRNVHHERPMKQVVRKIVTVAGVIIVFGALANGKAESQSMTTAYTAQRHAHQHSMHTVKTFIDAIQHHSTSGTSAEPNSAAHKPMLMTMKDNCRLMFHGQAFLNVLQQSGPRSASKVFSTNWFMPMAQTQLGPGTFTARVMFSLEPGTITHRYYPELFQQGATAFGKPIVDGQHPHEFIMELAALYDLKIGEQALLSFYFAPVGDPAIGPTAYPHRASASEDPIAPLGHHLEDSTHISDDVITVGLTYNRARFEASGFHGRGPDEFRWDIDSGKIDSWSIRATFNPAPNWSAQYSIAHLTSPETLHPAEDVRRMTASVMYNRPLAHGNWSSTLLWGRNRSLDTGLVGNGYLAESTLRFAERNYVWGRFENVDRTNELLLKKRPEPPTFEENIIGRVQAYSAGYERDVDLIPHLATGIGAQFTVYSTPASLRLDYGTHPVGGVIFLRIRPFGKER